ncbi:mucin-binding protein [Gemella morbillorum]|uniref:mucin-binding protein n=1 Tax=Gemella morbillorum TaxID=29391 RepID=UPI00248D61FB|nr:MucBP domain-containing protein [Gemella morbillorum]
MKKFNFDKNRKEIFSIRKLNVGVIPLAIMSLAVFGVATSSQELKASNNQTAENNKVESITQSIDNKNGLENSLEPKKRSKRALVDSSVITDFNATVTLRNDATVMNAGDTKNLSAQEVAFEKIDMTFKIKQDGTLKAGDTIRIPVTLTNNAYGGYYANLSSGTSEPIQGVGTIKFDSSNPNNLAYVITLNSDFANIPANTEKTVTVTQRAANGSKFTAKSSKKDIVLDINGKVFTFKPIAREFPKAEAIFSVYNSASTDRANSIKIGTSVGAANYYNNMLSSNGQNPGNNTKIPDGDIISIHHVKPAAGSTIIGIKPDNKRYTSTLAISEDGKYLVNKDTPTSITIDSDPDNKVIEMPANSSNEDILKALQKAGKNSSVVINNGDGTYTLGINLGKMKGEGITTYHDLRPTDDYAEFGDTYQEIDRTPEVNKQVSKILKDMSVIQGTGHSTRIIFADSSIKNSIEGSKSYSYSVDGNGVGTQLRTDDIKATTTPSNARAVGQTKITVRYVDTEGKEIETQDYRYGYPAGLATTPKSPNYDVKPKNIDNYTLITETTTVPGVAGTQLTTNKSIEFKGDDQNVYYVYKLKEGIAKVKYIDDTTNEVLEVKDDLKGKYNTKSTYTIDDTVKKYTDKNYEFVSSTYPTDGVTFRKEEQVFEVHLKHKTEVTQESKKVKQTINYVYKDNNPAEPTFPTVERELEFTRENTKDLVTNVVTNGQWTPANGTSFGEVVSPTKPGYTADKAKVEAVNNVTGDTADIVETVVYSPETQKLTYTVIDDTTNTTLEDKKDLASGDSNSEVKPETQTTYDNIVASYEAKGYEVVTKEDLPEKFDTDTTVDQNVTIHLKHKTEAVKEEKKVSLTVRYHGAGDKTPPNHMEEAVWTRTVTKDKVTGEIIDNGTWVSDKSKYAEVTSPVIEGYTADILVVATETVTQDNIVKDVNYTAKPQKPSNPETPGNPDPKTPENPSGNKDKQKALPSTGLNNTNNLTILGLLSIITAFGVRIIKKKH